MEGDFNINNMVWVRLTKAGHAAHAAYWKRYTEGVSKGFLVDALEIKEDANGWSEWQLWEFMAEVGYANRLGGDILIEGNIMRFSPPEETPC